MTDIALRLVDLPVRLTGVPADDRQMRTALAALTDPDPGSDPRPDPGAGERPPVTVAAVPGSLEDTLAALAQATIQHSGALLLHAAAVVRRGVAVLIPGESGAGKSTIAAACLAGGFDYITDELVAVDLESGAVTGVPRPLMLTGWSRAAIGVDPAGGNDPTRAHQEQKAAVPPQHWGASVVAEPLPAEHIVVPRLGAARTAVEPADSGRVLAAVLGSAFNHYRFGILAWECAVVLVRQATVWQLDVGDPIEAAAALADAVDQHADLFRSR